MKFLIFMISYSCPLLVFMSMALLQRDFYEEYFLSSFAAYNTFDLTIFYSLQILANFVVFIDTLEFFRIFPKLSKISLSNILNLPEQKFLIFLGISSMFIGPFLILISHLLSVSTNMKNYQWSTMIVNVFVPWLFIWWWMICLPIALINLLTNSWINFVKELTEKQPPQNLLKPWSRRCINLYRNIEEHLQIHHLIFCTALQISWIMQLFLAITFPFNLEKVPAIFMATGFSMFSISNFAFIVLLLFTADNLYVNMKNLKRTLRNQNNDVEFKDILEDLEHIEPLTGLGLFQIRKHNLTSMVSIAVTYLIILVQFRLTF